MLPPEARLGKVARLIDQAAYFAIHAPRQCGKTTSFQALAARLTREGRYTAVWTTCENAQAAGDDATLAIPIVLQAIRSSTRHLPEALRPPADEDLEPVVPLSRLELFLTEWAARSPRPIVLFLDEIDALRGNSLISVLRQLRTGYTRSPRVFPRSIGLIGLRDVRDYRLEEGPQAALLGTSSPFNIKVESLTLRDFDAEEVANLLLQHQEKTGQPIEKTALERIFELSQGQPWLVNALARQVVEEEVPDRQQNIEAAAVERAKEKLILRRDTHLDSLTERLREPRLQRVIAPILSGELFSAEVNTDDLDYAIDLGLLRRRDGNLEVANPIYREVIPRALASVVESSLTLSRPSFLATDGKLQLESLIRGFQEFWLEHAESFQTKAPYSEAAAQLVFMAYLHKVVNGGGFIDREYAVGSGRIDLCLRWPHAQGLQRFAFELKVRRGPDVKKKGLDQLASYLERLSLTEGTLLIFDQRPDAPSLPERGSEENFEHQGHRIRVVTL